MLHSVSFVGAPKRVGPHRIVAPWSTFACPACTSLPQHYWTHSLDSKTHTPITGPAIGPVYQGSLGRPLGTWGYRRTVSTKEQHDDDAKHGSPWLARADGP